jgi:N utilization substance protein B
MSVAPVPGAGGARRRARERALSLLYEAESKDVGPETVLGDLPVAPDRYAIEVVQGVAAHGEEIDGWLRRYAREWALERMPAIDRALLRMAVFELLHRPDVPTAVVLSEAVELASRYSTDDSGRFVNGVLAAVAAEAREGAPRRDA